MGPSVGAIRGLRYRLRSGPLRFAAPSLQASSQFGERKPEGGIMLQHFQAEYGVKAPIEEGQGMRIGHNINVRAGAHVQPKVIIE